MVRLWDSWVFVIRLLGFLGFFFGKKKERLRKGSFDQGEGEGGICSALVLFHMEGYESYCRVGGSVAKVDFAQ